MSKLTADTEESRLLIGEAVARAGVLIRYSDETNASGVLVQLGGRFFVFTAAHCVNGDTPSSFISETADGFGNIVLLGSRWGIRWTFEDPKRTDAGVIEVCDPGTFGEGGLCARAVSGEGLAVFATHKLPDAPVPFAVSGIPTAQRSNALGMRRHLGMILNTSHNPKFVDAAEPMRLPLLLETTGTDAYAQEVVAVPDLAGMSGGGTWAADLDVKQAFLVGTHQGRADRMPIAVTTLVAAHLAVVVLHVPELRAEILCRWPVVEDVLWHYAQTSLI